MNPVTETECCTISGSHIWCWGERERRRVAPRTQAVGSVAVTRENLASSSRWLGACNWVITCRSRVPFLVGTQGGEGGGACACSTCARCIGCDDASASAVVMRLLTAERRDAVGFRLEQRLKVPCKAWDEHIQASASEIQQTRSSATMCSRGFLNKTFYMGVI